MSTVPSISNSTGVTYATQLAQTSALKRSLHNLGNAIQKGDLNSASAILTGLIKTNPQYATASTSAAQSKDPINQDFRALADAISKNQVDTARTAWTQTTKDLAKAGVTDLSDGKAATAKLLAQNKASVVQQIMSNTLGSSSTNSTPAASLLAGSSHSNGGTDSIGSVVSNWITYKTGGKTSLSTAADSSGNKLDTAA